MKYFDSVSKSVKCVISGRPYIRNGFYIVFKIMLIVVHYRKYQECNGAFKEELDSSIV